MSSWMRRLSRVPPFSFIAQKYRSQILKILTWLRGAYRSLLREIGLHPAMKASDALKQFKRMPLASAADIVVCVHNAPEDTQACFEALIRHTNLRLHRLHIIDDGSDSATAELVQNYATKILGCYYRRHETALGYTRAANTGIRASSQAHVVLLNSDTLVTEGWVDALIQCARTAGPKVACVGPLSNAASWQSIPDQRAPDLQWAVNTIPEGDSPDTIAARIRKFSPRLYPQINFVNGFCYLMTREAIDSVGLLDEDNFPKGYGEEDDFSLRCSKQGFTHHIADDCYVFHAKSKSFTSEGRARIVSEIKEKFHGKHGVEKIKRLLSETEFNEALLKARSSATLAIENAFVEPSSTSPSRLKNRRIAWVVHHLGEVGGVRRILEMTNRLVAWGNDVYLLTPNGQRPTWAPALAKMLPTKGLSTFPSFDVCIYTDPLDGEVFARVPADLKICYHLAAYHLYRPDKHGLKEFYKFSREVHHIANSKWTAEKLSEYTQGSLQAGAVIPGGVDASQFKPTRTDLLAEVVCYGSSRPHKGTLQIEKACRHRKLLLISEMQAKQAELARFISSGRVFASACHHEGFNFCPLEAMACGIPVAMTDDGGSREYAINEENAIVVPPRDTLALTRAIDRLLEDSPLRMKLIRNGMRTAQKYSWNQVTRDFADYLFDGLNKGEDRNVGHKERI